MEEEEDGGLFWPSTLGTDRSWRLQQLGGVVFWKKDLAVGAECMVVTVCEEVVFLWGL